MPIRKSCIYTVAGDPLRGEHLAGGAISHKKRECLYRDTLSFAISYL